ncbi:MAG: HIT family protein [Nitratireductor sp.]|nr:HIT family protein [Nitratireductor sp.]MCB1457095.1 HIT family protein [Nitratireductor sp.]MCB1460585.1 HIT family protein [Nitratireductor sp.]
MADFELDERLASDSIELGMVNGCKLLLMNDRRWPWLVLVPMVAGAVEWHDLEPETASRCLDAAMELGKALKQATGCEKINMAAIGNIVRQLHIHVVARSPGDPNWPAPVWGFGAREPYADGEHGALEQALLSRLSPERQW